jgi:glutaredoxin-like protein
MPLIGEEDRATLRERFDSGLASYVNLIVFTKGTDCRFCKEVAQIAQELSEIDPRIRSEVLDADENPDRTAQLGITRVPATAIVGSADYRIRFYGTPAGHEFSTYVQDIINVSRADPGLSQQTLESIKRVDRDTRVQVFVTPSCPYCPRMVLMGHQFAMANERIHADMVEALEFPELVGKYGVLTVPRTIVNEKHAVNGLLPEPLFVEFLLHSVGLLESVSPALAQRLEQTEVEASSHGNYDHDHGEQGQE